MVMILFRKVIRTMFEHKARYGGAILLIMISSMSFVMLNNASMNLENAFTAFAEHNVLSDVEFSVDAAIDTAAIEKKFAAKIEPGATADYTVAPGQTVRLFSMMQEVNIPAVEKGRLPGTAEIMLDRLFAETNGYEIGNKITIAGQNFIVSGYSLLPNFIYVVASKEIMINDPKTFGVGVVNRIDFEALPGPGRVYALRFNARKNIQTQRTALKNALRAQGINITSWQDTDRKVNVSYVPMEIGVLATASAAVPLVMLLLTSVLLGMLMWRMIGNESVLIGTLYAHGYRKRELYRHYFLFPLLVSVTGAAAGSLGGILLTEPIFKFMITAFPMPLHETIYDHRLIAFSILIPVVTLCGITGGIVGKILRTPPAVLMKSRETESKINFVERNLQLDRLKFKTKFQIRAQVRSLSRSFFLLLGIIVATMLILYGFTLKSSVDYMLNKGIKEMYNLKHEYVFSSEKTGAYPVGTEPFQAAYVSLPDHDDPSFYVTGILPDTERIRLKDATGKTLKPEQVIATAPLVQKLNLKPGDEVTVCNTETGKEHTFVVEKVADTYAGEFLFMPLKHFNEVFGLPEDAYGGIWTDEPMTFAPGEIRSTKSIDTIITGLGSLIDRMGPMIYSMIFAAFAVGLIIIYLVTGLVIDENKTNISLLKVFGYRKNEINQLILNSNTFIVVAGYLLGLPALLGTVGVFYQSLTTSLQLILPVKLDPGYIILGFGIVLLTYEFAKLMCRKKVARIPMSEAMKAGTE